MNFFNKKNAIKQAEFSEEQLKAKKQQSLDCQKEIAEVLKKHNCGLDIKQEIVIIPN